MSLVLFQVGGLMSVSAEVVKLENKSDLPSSDNLPTTSFIDSSIKMLFNEACKNCGVDLNFSDMAITVILEQPNNIDNCNFFSVTFNAYKKTLPYSKRVVDTNKILGNNVSLCYQGVIKKDSYRLYNCHSDKFTSCPVLTNNTSFIYINDNRLIVDGKTFESDDLFTYAINVANGKCSVSVSYNGNDEKEFKCWLELHNRKTGEPSNASRIKYKPVDSKSGSKISSGNPYHFSFDLYDFRDKCQDQSTYSSKIYVAFYCFPSDYDGDYSRFFSVDVDSMSVTGNSSDDNNKLFDKKKTYPKFPSISKYLPSDGFPNILDYCDLQLNTWDFSSCNDILDYIGQFFKGVFMFLYKNIISNLFGFFKWLWASLYYIYRFLLGIIKWIGAILKWLCNCLLTALYNLVVDLRRLVIYLFVPDSEDLDYALDEKAPFIKKIKTAILNGKNSSAKSFKLFGHSFTLTDIPADWKKPFFTASSIVMYVFQVLFVVKSFFRIFGHNVASNDDNSDE